MKKFLTLPAFLLLSVFSKGQTYVSGFISANTTWTVAASPYIVTGNALVSQGYTLTIDPGVVVKFDPSCALQVDGQLIAIGTAANRITFTSNQAAPHGGDWAKLHFSDLCTDATFDANGNYLSGCIMKYCDVLYGGKLSFGNIHIESASPYFSNCNISNSKSSGIYCNGSSYFIDSSIVGNNAVYGLEFLNISSISCALSLIKDTIEFNTSGGVSLESTTIICLATVANCYFNSNNGIGAFYSSGSLNNLIVKNNYFVNNTVTLASSNDIGVLHITASTRNSILENYFVNNKGQSSYANIIFIAAGNKLFTKNTFLNNTTQGGGLVISNGKSSRISENVFINNSISGSLGGGMLQASGDTIECNLFQNNQMSGRSGGALYSDIESSIIRNNVFYGNYNNSVDGNSVCTIYGPNNNSGYFINNTIRNNSSPYSSCCTFLPGFDAKNLLFHISNNDFINNTASHLILIKQVGTLSATINFLYMKHNNFLNPQSQYELYNDIPYGSPNLYVDSNYWGSSSTQHIDSVIYDYFDFANKSVVYYQPILASPALVDSSCSFLTTVAPIADDKAAINPFPNPFSTTTQFNFSNELKDATLLLFNVFGQKVKEIAAINGRHISLNRENLPAGIYIYEVIEKQTRIANGKLLVE